MSKLEGNNTKNKKLNTINFNDFIDNDLRVAIELAKDTKINSIEDIKALKGYLDLSIMNTGINLTSLRGLEFAINIEQLYLTETGISNINEISSLSNLKWLEVNNNNITDINPVTNLINLEGLNISNNPINEMVSLNKLKNLKVLRMRNISNSLSIENLKELSLYTLNNIEILDLGDNALKDIVDELGNSLIPNLLGLASLGLEKNLIQSIEILSNLNKIIYLYLGKNKIGDISPISDKYLISVLDLSSNNIIDFSVISKLRGLQKLYLDNLNINDLQLLIPLGRYMKLQSLSLKNNNISNLLPLESLISLVILRLDNNKISDINSLKNLINLKIISLNNNYIMDIHILRSIKAFKDNVNGVKANNQNIIFKQPLIINESCILDVSNLLKDIDAKVPNIKNIQPKGEYYKFINIIKWNEVTLNDYLKFDFSDGIIEEGRLKSEVFSGSVLLATVIRFVDVNLENKLIYILNKTEDTRITDKDMINIIQLNLSSSGISNLSGLEYASNIERLDLSNNNLENINQLSNMKKLQYLDISYNKLSDLTPLFELENLKEVISTNQKIIYPAQIIRGNGEVKVLLDLLTCGVEYSASIKNISNLGYRQGNTIIWRNVIVNTTLKFDYEIQLSIGLNYKLSNGENRKTTLNIITSGNVEVPTIRDNITRGLNIFNY